MLRQLLIIFLSASINLINPVIGNPQKDGEWVFSDDEATMWQAYNFDNNMIADGKFSGTTVYEKGKKTPCVFSAEKLEIDSAKYKVLKIRIKSDKAGIGRVFFRRADEKFSDSQRAEYTLAASTNYQVITLDFSKNTEWNGIIDQIRIDCIYADGVEIEIDSVRFLSELSKRPEASWEFDDEDDLEGWTAITYRSYVIKNGSFSGITEFEKGIKTPTLLSPDGLNISSERYRTLQIKVKTSRTGVLRVFFKAENEKFSDSKRWDCPITQSGVFTIAEINLSDNAGWAGIIDQFRIDGIYADDESVIIDYIRLSKSGTELPKSGQGNYLPFFDPSCGEEWKISSSGAAVSSVIPLENKKILEISGKGSCVLETRKTFIDFPPAAGYYRLICEYKSRSKTEMEIGFTLFNSLNSVITNIHTTRNLAVVSAPSWSAITNIVYFDPRTTTFTCKITITSEDKFQIKNIFLLEETATAGFNETIWKGSWIWQKQEEKIKNRYFRKMFFLSNTVKNANLLITADDAVTEIYLNGKPLDEGKYSKSLWEIDRYDITSFLLPGNNLLAIKASNIGGPGSIICEAAFYLDNNTHQFIKSDNSFKTSDTFSKGWHQTAFVDSIWSNAVEYGMPPVSPWYHLDHCYMGPKKQVFLKKFIFPAQCDLGKNIAFSCMYAGINEEMNLVLYLITPDGRRIRVFSKRINNHTPSDDVSIAGAFIMPDWLDTGIYTAEIGFLEGESTPLHNAVKSFTALRAAESTLGFPSVKTAFKEGGIPFITINGTEYETMHKYTCVNGFIEKKLGLCRDNQIHVYWFHLFRWGYNAQGKYDFSKMDDECLKLLSIDPSAYFLIQIPVDSFHNPEMMEWNNANSQELVKDEKNNTVLSVHNLPQQVPSYASVKWRNEQKKNLTAVVSHLSGSKFAARVIGLMPLSGLGAEWVYWGAHNKLYTDYSEPFRKSFADWHKIKYTNIVLYNQRFNSRLADFNAISLPSKSDRLSKDIFSLLHPIKQRPLIDFRQHFSDLTAEAILDFGKTVKEASGRKILYGTYYGYNTYVNTPNWNESGHFSQKKLLESPDIDFLVSLVRYDNRDVGQESGFMIPEASLKLNRKLASVQADIRTLNAAGRSDYGRLYTLQDTLAVIKREFSIALIKGAAHEFGYYGHGWYASDHRLMDVMGKARRIENEMRGIARTSADPKSSFAVIVCDDSSYYSSQDSFLQLYAVREQMRNFPHSGAGFDVYLLSDIEKIPEYRCYIFLNTFYISQKNIDYINKNLKKDKKTLVWIFAPGCQSETEINFNRSESITGFKLRLSGEVQYPGDMILKPEGEFSSIITQEEVIPFPKGETGPLLAIEDGVPLGQRRQNSDVVAAVKKYQTWTSIYSIFPNLTPAFLQYTAKQAGLPVFNENRSDATYVTDRLLCLHVGKTGRRSLRFPGNTSEVKELFTDTVYKTPKGILNIEVQFPDTYLFFY